MTIEINREKAEHILLKIRKFLQNPSPIIRKLESVVGSVISIFPAIALGKLHYPALEKEKISLLKEKCGNYEAKISSLNKHTIEVLKWLGAIPNAKNNISTPQIKIFRSATMPVKRNGQPRMAPTLLGGFGQKIIRNTTLTIWNY